MTYRLNPVVRHIFSPVILRFGDENIPDRHFESGLQLAEETFDKNYVLESIGAQDNQILLIIRENRCINTTNWIGEEMVCFPDSLQF